MKLLDTLGYLSDAVHKPEHVYVTLGKQEGPNAQHFEILEHLCAKLKHFVFVRFEKRGHLSSRSGIGHLSSRSGKL